VLAAATARYRLLDQDGWDRLEDRFRPPSGPDLAAMLRPGLTEVRQRLDTVRRVVRPPVDDDEVGDRLRPRLAAAVRAVGWWWPMREVAVLTDPAPGDLSRPALRLGRAQGRVLSRGSPRPR
jgi:hypothetical protein